MSAPQSRRLRSGGQASVELVMVLPILLVAVAAICQAALGLNCYLVVGGASREGARRGAETNDAGFAREAAGDAAKGLPGREAEVDVSFPQGRTRGRPVRVTVTYTMPLLIPGLDRLLPEARFSRSTSMALERSE